MITQKSIELRAIAEQLSRAMARDLPIQTAFLFGSAARGTATRTSDIDLVVVMPTDARLVDRLNPLLPYWSEIDVGLDLFVLTPEEWAGWQRNPNKSQRTALREGIIVFPK